MNRANQGRRSFLALGAAALSGIGLATLLPRNATACEGDDEPIKTGRGATVTIAASDAPAIWKEQADYVCTGTDDDLLINGVMAGLTQLSAGTFHLSGALQPPQAVNIQGAGRWNTTLLVHGASDGVVINQGQVTIEHLRIQGASSESGIGILVDNNSRTTVKDIFVSHMGSHGIDWRLGNLGNLENIRCFVNGGDGLHISYVGPGAADAMAGTAIHLDLLQNGENGLFIGRSRGWNMVGVHSQGNGLHGYYIEGNHHTITGWVEAHPAGDVYLATNARANIIQVPATFASDVIDMGAFNMVLRRVNGTSRVAWSRFWAERVDITGDAWMPNLPTVDPGQSGRLWNDGGIVKVSGG